MVLDTSSVTAILLFEPERDEFLYRLDVDSTRLISAVSLVELEMVLSRVGGTPLLRMAALFLRLSSIRTVPFDLEQSVLAREAFHRFGKGRHSAALNFGDCMTYALTKQTGEPLLCKGNDFNRPTYRSPDRNRTRYHRGSMGPSRQAGSGSKEPYLIRRCPFILVTPCSTPMRQLPMPKMPHPGKHHRHP